MEQDGTTLRIHRHPTLPTYECVVKVGGADGLALLDTGATASFLTPEMASTASLELQTLPHALNATFLQGAATSITHFAITNTLINGHPVALSHRFYVTPMSTHDLLLGMDWIEAAKPEPNYALRTWDLRLPRQLPDLGSSARPPDPLELKHVVQTCQLSRDPEDILSPPQADDAL